MENIELKQNFEDHLKVHLSASNWRTKNCKNYSTIWDPKVYCKETFLDEFESSQAYVLYLNSRPTAAIVLWLKSPASANWSTKLKSTFEEGSVLYIDDLAVEEKNIGKGVIKILLQEVEKLAKERGFKSLRLDVDSSLKKLFKCYESNGFKVIVEEYDEHNNRSSSFMQKDIIQS
jgi:ribosomal protein S18 acetylase RimI-like enzyme